MTTSSSPISILSISIPLPLTKGPFHIHITIPYSLIVKDPNPVTRPRFWRFMRLTTRLFKFLPNIILTDPATQAMDAAEAQFKALWEQQLSALLFGRKVPAQWAVTSCVTKNWERVDDSVLFWTAFTGALDDIPTARVVVLKGTGTGDDGSGGMQFTLEKMGDAEKKAWKGGCRGVARSLPRPEFPADGQFERVVVRNLTLNRWMSGGIPNGFRGRKSSESESFGVFDGLESTAGGSSSSRILVLQGLRAASESGMD